MERNYIDMSINNRTLLLDVSQHFPVARDYEVERLAEALAHTSGVKVKSIVTKHAD